MSPFRALITIAILTMPAYANPVTTIATCNDGQKLQFNVNSAGPALLYAKTNTGILQIANYRATAPSQTWACGLPVGSSGPSAFLLCITRANASGGLTPSSIIVAKLVGSGLQQQGVVCAANVKSSLN